MKKVFMALMAALAITFTSCESGSWSDVLTSVHQDQVDYTGVALWSAILPTFTNAICDAQNGEIASDNAVIMRKQSDTSKAEAAAVKAAREAAEKVLGMTFEYKEGLFTSETKTAKVVKASSASDANLVLGVYVRSADEQEKSVATYYFKAE